MIPQKQSKVSPSSSSGNIKPGLLHRLFAWPISTNWTAGLLLVASFWLPHVRGCDNQIVVPAKHAKDSLQQGDAVQIVTLAWPYILGLLVAGTVALSAVMAWRFADRVLLALQASFYFGFWSAVWFSRLFPETPSTGFNRRETLLILAEQMPIHLITIFWCGAAILRRDWATAWARMSTILMMLAACWIYLSHLFAKEYYYGFYIALASLLGMLIGPWLFRIHWQRLLVSSNAPKRPLQFRLAHLFVAITLFALLYGYYRYLPKAFDD